MELESTERLYAAVHVCSTADVSPHTVYAHFVFRRDPRGQSCNVAYKLMGGSWKGASLLSKSEPFPFAPETPLTIRITFTPEGFFMYYDNQLFTLGARRQPEEAIPKPGTDMFLNLPTGGDAGEKSVLQCTKAWWGTFQPPPAHIARLPKPRTDDAVHREYEPGQLYVSGLPASPPRRDLMEHFQAHNPEDVELHPERLCVVAVVAALRVGVCLT